MARFTLKRHGRDKDDGPLSLPHTDWLIGDHDGFNRRADELERLRVLLLHQDEHRQLANEHYEALAAEATRRGLSLDWLHLTSGRLSNGDYHRRTLIRLGLLTDAPKR